MKMQFWTLTLTNVARFARKGIYLNKKKSHLELELNKRGSLPSQKDLILKAILDLDFDKRGLLRSQKDLI